MFQKGSGDWTVYRSQCSLSPDDEIDLHFGRRNRFEMTYSEVMGDVEERVERCLKEAQRKGRSYLMFRHGGSTSRPGRMTARSVVRGFMRSKAATPFIERKHCIQHDSVFVAKLRPLVRTCR
jgi:hypothetical protein